MRHGRRAAWVAGIAGGLLGALVSAVVSGYVAGNVTQGQVHPSSSAVRIQTLFDARRAAYSRIVDQVASFQLTEAQFEVEIDLSERPQFDGFDVIGLEDSLAMELSAIQATASSAVRVDADIIRRAVRDQLVTMVRLASARREAPGTRQLTLVDLGAMAAGQVRVAQAIRDFLTAAHDDLGVALS
jgi:hypothetical protein